MLNSSTASALLWSTLDSSRGIANAALNTERLSDAFEAIPEILPETRITYIQAVLTWQDPTEQGTPWPVPLRSYLRVAEAASLFWKQAAAGVVDNFTIDFTVTFTSPLAGWGLLRNIPSQVGWHTAFSQLDKDHVHRGLGLKAGFSSNDRFLWSMLSTYLMYAIDPPLLIESVSCVAGQGFKALSRMVRVTQDGASTVLFQREVRLRYPLDLMQLEEAAVSSLLNGAKHSRGTVKKIKRSHAGSCSAASAELLG
jgi:hypothetical protein